MRNLLDICDEGLSKDKCCYMTEMNFINTLLEFRVFAVESQLYEVGGTRHPSSYRNYKNL